MVRSCEGMCHCKLIYLVCKSFILQVKKTFDMYTVALLNSNRDTGTFD